MPAIQIETEQLLNAALQMPRPELERFVARLFALKAREETPNLSEAETRLLLKINQDLPPVARNRMNELIESQGITHIEARPSDQPSSRAAPGYS
ncbi:MAG: hypothetical protein ACREAM_29360, partial [Blastocatellia bacterium]